MIRTTIAGNVIEKSKFWVSGGTKVRGARVRTSSVRKQDQNDQDAVKRLAREINANFQYHDLLLTLNYDAAGYAKISGDREKAKKEAGLFLRRLGRAMKKAGLALKYIAVTSDMDGDSGRDVRVHHHILLPAEAAPYIDACWTLGSCFTRQMHGQADYTPVAVYLLRQVRRVKDAKKWTVSRNLAKPIVYERRARAAGALRNPPHTILMGESAYDIETGSHYIRYVKAPKPGEEGTQSRGGKGGAPS